MRSAGKPDLVIAHDDSGEIESLAGMVSQGATLMRTQTQFSTAVQVQIPRQRKRIQELVLEEAELTGDEFFYSWSTKNRDGSRGLVEGLSIEGAMILFRNWGNCAIPTEVVAESPTHWTFCTTFVDMETGVSLPRLFRQRKSQSTSGKMDADRMMDIAFQIGLSKCQRNAIDKFMPSWLSGPALEKAKANAEGKFSDLDKSNKDALRVFGKLGVSQRQLEDKLQLKMEFWTPRDHVSLSGLFRAIRDRQTTLAEEFPREEQPAAAATPAAAAAPEKPAEPAQRSGYGDDDERTPTAATAPAADPTPATDAAASATAKPAAAAPTGDPGKLSAEEMAEIAKAERDEAAAQQPAARSKRPRGED